MTGVQRSSISHVLSGRNKPSLNFWLGIEAAFDEIRKKWLLKEKINRCLAPLPVLKYRTEMNGKIPQKH